MMLSFIKRALFTVLLLCLVTSPLCAQQKTFNFGIELQARAATDPYLPFWLYSNQHGLVDLNSPGSNAILNFQKNIPDDRQRFDYGFGATLVGRYSKNETVFFNQLYGKLAYGALQIKGGRFYEQLGTTDRDLSMGSLAISPNATPMPKVKIGFLDYTDIPLTRGLIEFKAEIAHGWFEQDREIQSPWLHQKSVYFRFGGDFAFRPYAGLTDQATWGGHSQHEGNLPDSFSDFLNVFLAKAGSGSKNNGENAFKLGDHRGIWDFGFYLTAANFDFLGYRQYIYNDKDGIKLQTPDGLTGLSIRFPTKNQHLVTGFVYEYLYTKNQSGPIPPQGNSRNGPGGRDNYYNNYLYRTGWTYEGQTIGNPLFLNAYNPQLDIVANGQLNLNKRYGVSNNRIVAHHFGLMGQLSPVVDYKLLATWSRNYGNYYDGDLFKEQGVKSDFYSHPEQWSFLAKFSYQPFRSLKLNASLAGDVGKIYDNRIGILVGIELLGTSSF